MLYVVSLFVVSGGLPEREPGAYARRAARRPRAGGLREDGAAIL